MALTEAVGPIQSSNEAENLDLMKIPDFVAGFVYGLTGDMKLTEIEACYQGGEKLEIYIQNFMADIKKFHMIKAIWQLQLFLFHL